MWKTLLGAAMAAGLMLMGAGCSNGGAAECAIEECYRLVNCVEECGGPVIQSSCCACPEGTVDDIDCPSEGGG
jgi:hypothetical protein